MPLRTCNRFAYGALAPTEANDRAGGSLAHTARRSPADSAARAGPRTVPRHTRVPSPPRPPATVPRDQRPSNGPATIETCSEIDALAGQWNALALGAGNLFQTHEWLSGWWRAFGRGDPRWIVLRDADGTLRAGACLSALRANGLASAANVHSATWDVLARDEAARGQLWAAIADLGANRMHFRGLPQSGSSERLADEELRRAGYRVLSTTVLRSPWLALPASWEQLLASLSSGMRSRIRRTERTLEKHGSLSFRTVAGGAELERDLDRFLALEASGWKGRNGSAIAAKPATERLYRDFALAAARQGWMRMYTLELDGQLIAASYACVFAGESLLLKMAFDETRSALSPGSCLLARMIRSAIEEEHLSACDFLGEADRYKLRWAPEVRPRMTVWAYRGAALPGYTLRRRVRPMAKSVRDRIRS
jgi:CelD/BcsL family acetyltransferase involved in cellulose biosynthesis